MRPVALPVWSSILRRIDPQLGGAVMADPEITERFTRAVRTLATLPEVIQERVGRAWLDLVAVRPEALPRDLGAHLAALQRLWEAGEDEAREGKIMVASHRLTVDRAVEEARWIVDAEAALRSG